jgi:hypothetical protein
MLIDSPPTSITTPAEVAWRNVPSNRSPVLSSTTSARDEETTTKAARHKTPLINLNVGAMFPPFLGVGLALLMVMFFGSVQTVRRGRRTQHYRTSMS